MEKQNDKKTKKLKNSLTIALSIISCIIVQHTTSASDQKLTKIKPIDITTTEKNKIEMLGEEEKTQLLQMLTHYYTYALSTKLSIPLAQIEIIDEVITLQQQTIQTLLNQIGEKIKNLPTNEGPHTTQAITTTTFSMEDKNKQILKKCQEMAEYFLNQVDINNFKPQQKQYIEILKYLQLNKTQITELISKTYNAQVQGPQNQINNTLNQQIWEIITLATEYLATILQIK